MNSALRKFVVIGLLIFQSIASAQNAVGDEMANRRAVANKIFQQLGYDKLHDQMSEQMVTAFKPLVAQMVRGLGLPDNLARDFIDRFPANFATEFKRPEVKQQFVDVSINLMVADFSTQELEQLYQIYTNPVIQKMIGLQGKYMEAGVAQGQKLGEIAGRKAAEVTLDQMGVKKR